LSGEEKKRATSAIPIGKKVRASSRGGRGKCPIFGGGKYRRPWNEALLLLGSSKRKGDPFPKTRKKGKGDEDLARKEGKKALAACLTEEKCAHQGKGSPSLREGYQQLWHGKKRKDSATRKGGSDQPIFPQQQQRYAGSLPLSPA